MTACTSLVSTVRSTPLTISVPSSSATCRFLSSSFATCAVPNPFVEWFPAPIRDASLAGPRQPPGGRCSCRSGRGGPDEPPPQAYRRPQGRGPGAVVEAPVRARIAGERGEEVVGRVDRLRLAGRLLLPAHPQQHPVAEARR